MIPYGLLNLALLAVSLSVSPDARCTCRRTSNCRDCSAGNNYFANLVSSNIRHEEIYTVGRDSKWSVESSVTWGIIVSIAGLSLLPARRTSKCRHFSGGNNYFANLVTLAKSATYRLVPSVAMPAGRVESSVTRSSVVRGLPAVVVPAGGPANVVTAPEEITILAEFLLLELQSATYRLVPSVVIPYGLLKSSVTRGSVCPWISGLSLYLPADQQM